MSGPLVSLVVPVYNEGEGIARSVRELADFVKESERPMEVIFVDDGSIDQTPAILQQCAKEHDAFRVLTNPQNHGKGYSVRRGMLDATGAFRFFLDADLSYPLSQVEPFLVPLIEGEADVVIGSRRLAGASSETAHSISRKCAAGVFSWLVKCLFGLDLTDTQSGFKCFTAAAADEVFSRQTIDGFAFDVEVLALARRQGFRIAELPTQFLKRGRSTLRLLHDGPAMLRELIRIKRNAARGLDGSRKKPTKHTNGI